MKPSAGCLVACSETSSAAPVDLDGAPWRGRPGQVLVGAGVAARVPGLLPALREVARLVPADDLPTALAGGNPVGAIVSAGAPPGPCAPPCPVLYVAVAGNARVAAFVEAVCVAGRWWHLVGAAPDRCALQDFHARHKYLLMARDPATMRALGRTLARDALPGALDAYASGLAHALARVGSSGRHADAMAHMAGHLRHGLMPSARRELAATIDAFRVGRLPRASALGALRDQARRQGDPYLCRQFYLQGAPAGLRPFIESI